jgi:1,4-dihydroxy-2-naphthoyl-CoA hydrolase
MPFTHVVTVRFNEVDRAGIAFFGRVFEWCHEAYEELFSAAGLAMQEIFDRESWGMPLVHAEADYRRPMRLGDRLAIDVRVERVGSRSVTFAYTVRGEGKAGGDIRATARLVHAFIHLASFTPRQVPACVRDALDGMGLLPPADAPARS